MIRFKKITIAGVGLLGGSVGLAVKKYRIADEVVGYFRHKDKIKKSIAKGAIDRGTTDFFEAVGDCDLIILSSPVNDIIEKLGLIKKLGVGQKTLITDTGSTKSEIVRAAGGLNFIGAHPLAGSEHSGVGFADHSLFKNSLCLLTPTGKEKKGSLRRIALFWQHLGARTKLMDAESHDRILAFTSHLPHAAAFSLISALPQHILRLSAGGLRDATRIAMSEPKVWADIFLSNKKNVILALQCFEKELKRLENAIRLSDRKTMMNFLSGAVKKRKTISPSP